MHRMKVMTVVERPEIIRLARVIVKLDDHCDHILVHTGQNYDYELNQIFFDDLEIRKPDHFLNSARATSIETIGKVIVDVDQVLADVKPKALLCTGRHKQLYVSIAAKRRKIPVFHMEAGNRCFDQRVPEEINRRIIDHTADINLTYSSIAREYLLREGLPADMIIKTGSPMNEVLNYYLNGIKGSDVLNRLRLEKEKYFVVSAHREENIDSEINFNKLIVILSKIAQTFDMPLIVSTHPRTQKKIESSGVQLHENIQLLKPLGLKIIISFKSQLKLCCLTGYY